MNKGCGKGKDSSRRDGSNSKEEILQEPKVIFQRIASESPQGKTLDKINHIIHVMSKWYTGDKEFPNQRDFRKAHKDGYRWIDKFVLPSKVDANSSVPQLHLKNPT